MVAPAIEQVDQDTGRKAQISLILISHHKLNKLAITNTIIKRIIAPQIIITRVNKRN